MEGNCGNLLAAGMGRWDHPSYRGSCFSDGGWSENCEGWCENSGDGLRMALDEGVKIMGMVREPGRL